MVSRYATNLSILLMWLVKCYNVIPDLCHKEISKCYKHDSLMFDAFATYVGRAVLFCCKYDTFTDILSQRNENLLHPLLFFTKLMCSNCYKSSCYVYALMGFFFANRCCILKMLHIQKKCSFFCSSDQIFVAVAGGPQMHGQSNQLMHQLADA
jgi:hypothetical protein